MNKSAIFTLQLRLENLHYWKKDCNFIIVYNPLDKVSVARFAEKQRIQSLQLNRKKDKYIRKYLIQSQRQ